MVWLEVAIELVWLEDIRTGLVGRCYNWFGLKMLELVWLEDTSTRTGLLENARTGLVRRY